MKRALLSFCLLMVISLLAACGSNEEQSAAEQETSDIKGLVSDFTAGNMKDQSASITSHELIVTNSDQSKKVYDLSEEEFFVSIAPYINNTHPCQDHNLTGCQGELVGQEVSLYIEDSEGNVIKDEIVTTQDNGFIDLWLPRDDSYRVTVKQGDLSAESEISTFEGNNTCITDMQLL